MPFQKYFEFFWTSTFHDLCCKIPRFIMKIVANLEQPLTPKKWHVASLVKWLGWSNLQYHYNFYVAIKLGIFWNIHLKQLTSDYLILYNYKSSTPRYTSEYRPNFMTVYCLTKQVVWRRKLQMTGCRREFCRWEEKNRIIVFPSHNITVQNTSSWSIALETTIKSSWEVWNPAGPPHESCWLSVSSPPSVLFVWYVGRAIYTVLSAKEQFLRTQCLCHSVLWHTGPHHIIIIFISHLLLLTLRKSKLNFFWQFSNLAPWILKLFVNSLLSIFGCLSRGPASRLTIIRTIWSKCTQSRLMVPLDLA